MNWKAFAKALLLPPLWLMLLLIPAATGFLVYSMLALGSESIPAILSYVLAFYTLTVWCLRLPRLIKKGKSFWEENPYARRWQDDPQLRMKISLNGSLLWNVAYALLQLGLGVRHHTFWFTSLGIYYLLLAGMRLTLARHTRRHAPREEMRKELIQYRACGIVFLLMNLALTVMIFFMVYWNRTFHHHEITTIALAAYTFTSLTLAVVNVIRYRKYNSPVYSASKAISLASACVSMLTLESTMLTTFGGESLTLTHRRIFLGASGAAISAFIILMAIYMITKGTKKIRQMNQREEKLHE
ncbi:MAG: hypothetical protein IIX85_00130 [Clostridia bacterium]|nr:hypothetical protein [Clostridia bacterium]